MSNLSRFNPFRKISSHGGDLYGQAGRFFDHLPSWPIPGFWSDQRTIGVDVTDQGDNYLVEAEIPGVKKENISVSVDGNHVNITAEIKKDESRREGETALWNERYFGRVFRSFTLDQHVDEDHSKASYNDGILKLELPKKGGSSTGKQITIS